VIFSGLKTLKKYPGWWFQTFFIFRFIYGTILPVDELIFFKMVKATKQLGSPRACAALAIGEAQKRQRQSEIRVLDSPLGFVPISSKLM